MPSADNGWIERLRSVSGCVTAQRSLVRRPHDPAGPTVALFATPAPLRFAGALAGAQLGVRLSVDERSAAFAGFPSIVGYDYAFEDRNGVELLSFHLHLPNARGHHPRPHLHVSAALRPLQPNGDRGLVPLDKRHLPTGPVSLGEVVAMLAEEFGADPLVADWRARLADANAETALG